MVEVKHGSLDRMSTPSSPIPDSTATDPADATTATTTPAAYGPSSATGDPWNGMSEPPPHTRWPLFLAADLVLVLVFAAIGRASHGEDVAGLFLTAWPFMLGALAGWLASRGSRHPAAMIPTGLAVWVCAEVVGMVLRAFTGQGTALPFVVVSIVVLGVLLVGYRLLVAGAARLLRR